jgi:hypothetical protein
MICEQCKAEGKKSNIYPKGTFIEKIMSPLLFYDEGGTWHVHDYNPIHKHWECSNGHKIVNVEFARCWCEPDLTLEDIRARYSNNEEDIHANE